MGLNVAEEYTQHEPTHRYRHHRNQIANSPLPFVRQFVPAERVLRLASPRSETPHDKPRIWVLYPNGYLLRPDIYRPVSERIGAGAIGATKIFPGDFHLTRPALGSSFASS